MQNLANSYDRAGRTKEALVLRKQVVELCRREFGPEHSDTLEAITDLAQSYDAVRRFDSALELYDKVIRLQTQKFSSQHPATLNTMQHRANSYGFAGRNVDALTSFRELLPLFRKVHGPTHPNTLTLMQQFANALGVAGDLKECIRQREEALAGFQAVLRDRHPDILKSMRILARDYFRDGRRGDAVRQWKTLFEQAPADVKTLNDVAWLLATTENEEGDFTHTREAVEWARKANQQLPANGALLNTQGVAYYRCKQWRQAIASLRDSITHGFDVPHNWLFIAMANHQSNQQSEAIKWYDKSLQWKAANPAELQKDVELQRFYAEAEQLMKKQAAVPSDSQPDAVTTEHKDK